jgi:hypothetical protein
MRSNPRHLPAESPQATRVNGAATPGPASPVPGVGGAAGIPSITTQAAATLGLLAGLWAAISPWFLVLQTSGRGNTTANNLITGLVVVAIALMILAGARGLAGLKTAALLAGVWLIISPFILDARVATTASMYWSNVWTGAVVVVASLAALAAGKARAQR